jgi:hypothetical protein
MMKAAKDTLLRAFAGGGYETRTGRGSREAPEALNMVEDAAVALLDSLAGPAMNCVNE